jgi:hypothetical protein
MPEQLFTDDHVVYRTDHGTQVCGDSLDLLALMPDESVDLVMTSPPFALLRAKKYGNADQAAYVEWLTTFGEEVKRVLKPTGSFVLDLGGAYKRGSPTRSLYQFRVLIKFVDDLGFHLAEEFYWYNPAKLPSPIEWVNKRKIRVKDAVNTVWWFSKNEYPKADVTQVLQPYSKRMQKLLENPEAFYDAKGRPSEHSISTSFGNDNGGAIPPNLIQLPNTDSNSSYLRTARRLGRRSRATAMSRSSGGGSRGLSTAPAGIGGVVTGHPESWARRMRDEMTMSASAPVPRSHSPPSAPFPSKPFANFMIRRRLPTPRRLPPRGAVRRAAMPLARSSPA